MLVGFADVGKSERSHGQFGLLVYDVRHVVAFSRKVLVLLGEALDRIHGWGAPSESAQLVAANLDEADLRAAATIHLAALFEHMPTAIENEHVSIAGMAVRLVRSPDPNAAIFYRDVGIGFQIVGAEILRRNGPTMLADLLSLIQIARDHADSIAYLSPSMRDQRIQGLADEFSVSEQFALFIVVNCLKLLRKVGG
ncbi:hypothetical protein [Bosea vestrisii]|uniref:Uncharacterized protein n=1 Tax=Bosea vestrisii TaxID=151416 RepID=A0ABW0HIR8_9HYPH